MLTSSGSEKEACNVHGHFNQDDVILLSFHRFQPYMGSIHGIATLRCFISGKVSCKTSGLVEVSQSLQWRLVTLTNQNFKQKCNWDGKTCNV